MRVLLVDDEPEIVDMLSGFLRDNGVSLEVRYDAREAAAMLGSEHFDMVITDYHMPHLDGGELLAHLKAQPGMDEVPVIVVTADDDPDLGDRLMRQGAAWFMRKPIDMLQVLCLVRFAEGA